MPPRKRAAAGKRARYIKKAGTDASQLSPVPESETASTSRETRSRSKRTRFAPLSPEPGDDSDINEEGERDSEELEREFNEWLAEEPPSSPLTAAREARKRGAIRCYDLETSRAATIDKQVEAYRRKLAGYGGVTEDFVRPSGARNKQNEAYKPSGINFCPGWPVGSTGTKKERENRAWHATKKDLTHEETLDWYMDAALKEVKGVMQLASENRLRQADLWNLLTFGQHMYAGIRRFYDVDLNDALLERERGNLGKGLHVALPPAELPWPRPVPKRCGGCSRVRTTYLTSEHPWNRTSFGRLYPQEDRYEPGGLFGEEPPRPLIGLDPLPIPERMGTTHRGWDV